MDYEQYQMLALPRAPLLVNPQNEELNFDYTAGNYTLTVDSIIIGDQVFPRAGYTFIFSFKQSFGEMLNKNGLVIITDDQSSLPRIGTLIPHYGKYSYLVFEGTKNVAKGQWEVTKTPLSVQL